MRMFENRVIPFFAFIIFVPFLASCGGSSSQGGSAQAEETTSTASTTPSTASSGATRGGDSTASPATAAGTPTPAVTAAASDPVPTPPDPAPAANPPGAPPPSGWRTIGERVNAAQGSEANLLSLATLQGAPQLAWEEGGKVYAAALGPSGWTVEGPLNVDAGKIASVPTLATDGQGLYLSFTEEGTVYVMRKDAGKWATVAAQPPGEYCAPANADLDVRAGVPTVAWDLSCPDTRYASTRVGQWAGSWIDLQGEGSHYLNQNPKRFAIRSNEKQLSLAVISQNAADDGVTLDLFHHDADAAKWVRDGGPANDPLAYLPSAFSLAFVENQPTLAFEQEGTIRVRRWNGQAWTTMGSSAPPNGADPALIAAGGTPYLGFGGAGVSVLRWNGTAWVPKGEAVSPRPGFSVSLAAGGQQLYAAWIESGSIFVKSIAQ